MHKHKHFFLFLAGMSFITTLSLAGFISITRADSASSAWMSPSSLTLQKQAELSVIPTSLNGNTDCFQDGDYNCVVSAKYGAVNQNGQVRLNGTSPYRDTVSYVDNRVHTIAIPNSDTIINYTTEPSYGFYLYFTNSFSNSISSVTPYGSIIPQYQINRAPDGKLADKTNHRLAADYTSISFSPNGQWMIVSDPNVAMLRVNLQTFEVLPFSPGFNYTIGVSPNPQTAITNDGRYAVVASKDFSRFTIYDLNSCASVPDTINGPVACQSRDLQSLMQQQVTGYTSATNIRFISDDTLSLFGNYTAGSIHKTAKYIFSTASGGIHQLDYLALGDSYISGEGAFNYQPGTDTSDNRCHLSLVSYPYLLGRDLNYSSYRSIACSGAKTEDVTNVSDSYGGQTQLKVTRKKQDKDGQVPAILSSFQPGYIDQLDFVSTYQPKIMTISIGGNDIGFSNIVKHCTVFWELDTCYNTYEDRLELVRNINSQFPALVDTYTKIKNQSPPDSRIYIVGYPQTAKPGGNCALNVHLNAEELDFSRQLISYLDLVIHRAANSAGVDYVDVEDALNGHRLCETQSDSVAINGLTAGNDKPSSLYGPIGDESYHPNELGHQLLEDKILSATHNLSDGMPAADPLAAPPPEGGLEILNAPHSGRGVNKTMYDDDLVTDTVLKGSVSDISIDSSQFSLQPNAIYRTELHSTPLALGSFTSGLNGSLAAQIQIPQSVPAGIHTLHVYGTNIAGESVDIFKNIYVASSLTDYDGDGISNIGDPCGFIGSSHQDYDKDGIDDSCDGFIDKAPLPVAVPAAVNSSASSSSQLLSSEGEDTRSSNNPVVEDESSQSAEQSSFQTTELNNPDSNSTTPEVLSSSSTTPSNSKIDNSDQGTTDTSAKSGRDLQLFIKLGAAISLIVGVFSLWKINI